MVYNESGEQLLVRRGIEPQKGKWCFPCGFINPQEPASDAAVREVREEAGIRVENLKLLDVRSPANENKVIILYRADYSGKTPATPGDDATEVKWVRCIDSEEMAFRLHVEFAFNAMTGAYWSTHLPPCVDRYPMM
jgi:8-oxo-dGTP diphosphatase